MDLVAGEPGVLFPQAHRADSRTRKDEGILSVAVRYCRWIAEVDQLMGVQDEKLSALDIVARPCRRYCELIGYRSPLV
jgi:hypothetical protein